MHCLSASELLELPLDPSIVPDEPLMAPIRPRLALMDSDM
jgi:hypothetical protein